MNRQTFKKAGFSAAILLATVVGVQNAEAVVVTPSSGALLSGTTAALSPDLAGVVIRDELIPFQVLDTLGNVVIEGNVQDRVVQSNNSGELIFAPRLRDLSAPGGVAWITGFSMSGYNGYSTDIDYRLDGLGDVGPNSVSRDAGGDNLYFRYDPNLVVAPDESLFMSVDTDAFDYDLSGLFTIYAQNDFGANVFVTRIDGVSAPSAVPVPAAAWLFGSGLVGLIGIMRRRDSKLA